jgi:hypothetical protein
VSIDYRLWIIDDRPAASSAGFAAGLDPIQSSINNHQQSIEGGPIV